MKIIHTFPPNHSQITIPHREGNVYCYGDTIYAPGGGDIPEDIMVHEHQHSLQQQAFTNPDVWWNRYCLDDEFRLQQELEAYARQLNWIREKIPGASEEALEEMGWNLSRLYELGLSVSQCIIKIRNTARDLR